MFSLTSLFVADSDLRKDICGNLCCGIVIAMYGSPCWEAAMALKSRNASQLSLPLATGGFLNGCIWGLYGLALGNTSISLPNGLGATLSVFNIIVKLYIRCGASKEAHKKLLTDTLKNALSSDHGVFLQSAMSGAYLQVPPLLEESLNLEMAHGVQVTGSSTGTALKIIQLQDEHVGFRLVDGRWLSMSPGRPSETSGEVWVPGAYHVTARKCDHPGEAGTFLPVNCGGLGLRSEACEPHKYGSATYGFWNPLYHVFCRIDDNGNFDSSVVVNPIAGKVRMPAGWYRERFELQFAHDHAHAGTLQAQVSPRLLSPNGPCMA
jgi:hypothetical protein